MASIHPWKDATEQQDFKAQHLEENKVIRKALRQQQQKIRGTLAKKALKRKVLLDKKQMDHAARRSQAASIRAGAVDLGRISGHDAITLMNTEHPERTVVLKENPQAVFRRNTRTGVVKPKDVNVRLEFEGRRGEPLARLEKAVKKHRYGRMAGRVLKLLKKPKKGD